MLNFVAVGPRPQQPVRQQPVQQQPAQQQPDNFYVPQQPHPTLQHSNSDVSIADMADTAQQAETDMALDDTISDAQRQLQEGHDLLEDMDARDWTGKRKKTSSLKAAAQAEAQADAPKKGRKGSRKNKK